jgi:4-amino-4-deoxy-L-arabinose transferase-like glycosyltransferase
MLTYTPPHEQDLPQPTERPWLLLLLCLVWLMPGVMGREPLKPDETIVADIVKHMLNGGPLSLPLVAGEPWVVRAPLFYWVATVFAGIGQWFGIAIHSGARVATLVFTALALWGTGMAGRELVGRRHGRSAVLILVGSVGLLLPGHMLAADTAVLAGWTWGIYALALALRRAHLAGLVLAASLVLSGLAGSLAEPLLLAVLALGLPMFSAWRRTSYGMTLLLALALSIPIIMSWPLALARIDPNAFNTWWDWHALGFWGGFAAPRALHPFGYYFKMLPWFAWPGWFLAAATLRMQSDRLKQPRFQLPLLASALVLICLVSSQQQREGYALLILPPLALVGAVGLDVLRRGASAFVNWFGVMSFGVLILFLWTSWAAMHLGFPPRLAQRVVDLAPGFRPHLAIGALLVGLAVTAAWAWAVSRRRPVGRQAVTNWAAGVTAVWCLAVVFAGRWIDTRTAYRDLAHRLAPHLPVNTCVSSENLQASQRAVMHYYIDLITVRREGGGSTRCDWLLRQGGSEALYAPPGWHAVWDGSRAGDHSEHYYLYRKDIP